MGGRVNELDKRKTPQIRDDLKSVKPNVNGVNLTRIKNNVKKSKRKEMRGLARGA